MTTFMLRFFLLSLISFAFVRDATGNYDSRVVVEGEVEGARNFSELKSTRRQLPATDNLCAANTVLGGWAAHKNTPFHPDMAAIYITSGFGGWRLKRTALKITHPFPRVRYHSVFIHNLENSVVVGGFPDVEIVADPGSVNPFTDPERHNTTKPKNYTIWISSSSDDEKKLKSHFGSDTIRNFASFGDAPSVAVLIRLYNPDANRSDYLNYVVHPEIRAYDPNTGLPTKCPRLGVFPPQFFLSSSKVDGIPVIPPNDTISFYHMSPANTFPDSNNSAYAATITYLPSLEDAILMQLRIPKFTSIPNTPQPTDDVRYLSVCSDGTKEYSRVGSCLTDRELLDYAVGNPPVATILLAQNVSRFAAKAAAMGAATMEMFGDSLSTIIVVRQKIISAHFMNNSYLAAPLVVRTPPQQNGTDGSGSSSSRICLKGLCSVQDTIGDWSPKAKYCTKAEVLSNGCLANLIY